MKKKPNFRQRVKKNLLSRYRLVILNEENYEEQFFFRLSILNVLIISTFLFSFLITSTLLIVSYTSLKEFIPGYASNLMRKQAVLNSSRLDSLTISYNQSLNQLNSIKKVLTGDIEFEEFKEIEFKLDTENIDVKLNSKKGLRILKSYIKHYQTGGDIIDVLRNVGVDEFLDAESRKPYRGPYHSTYDNQFYTGVDSYDPNKKLLVPNPNKNLPTGISRSNLAKNNSYDNLKCLTKLERCNCKTKNGKRCKKKAIILNNGMCGVHHKPLSKVLIDFIYNSGKDKDVPKGGGILATLWITSFNDGEQKTIENIKDGIVTIMAKILPTPDSLEKTYKWYVENKVK